MSQFIPESINSNSGISPSLLWVIIAATVIFVCVAHCLVLLGAQYLSPFTRDLAIDDNDLPYRRAVLLNIGMAVLVSFAFVTACPLLRLSLVFHVTPVSYFLAIALLFAAAAVCLTTLKKTGPYFYCKTESESLEYLFFNVIALMALIMTVAIWTSICFSDAPTGMKNYAGVYFSYRCLHPMSGVCPLVPVILLLTAWYCWSICQTARLRFSEGQRPRIARRIVDNPGPYPPQISPYDLFVPDETLDACSRPVDCCLYKNMTSLLITREVVRRFVNNRIFRLAKSGKMPSQSLIKSRINWGMAIFYVVLFALCLFALHIQSLDRFVFAPFFHLFGSRRNVYGPTLYEFLVVALFFPLIMVSLSGCLRTVLIWGSLSRGLLEPLERMPIRFAFTRIKIGSWMALLRQSGLNIRWRDVSRSIEAIRQFLNHPDLTAKPDLSELKLRLSLIYGDLNSAVETLLPLLGPPPHDAISIRLAQPPGWDHPKGYGFDVLRLIYTVEVRCAKFSHVVLRDLLIPHWERNRVGLVEDCNDSAGGEESELDKGKKKAEHKQPSLVDLAEELIVIRYIALIRQVLVNMRYLTFFVSVAFVLSLIAWNSYPFQPHALIDWCFTILLTIITIGFIAVFVQVHRNGILSRITNTAPNVLGWDFYIRLITFGAIPVLTWLAYQFPQIGGSLYRIFQPGLQVVK